MSERLATDLLEQIREQRMVPGDRLPTESELSSRYGVSRSVVREATRTLVARGVAEVGSGRGLKVAAVGGDLASESLTLYLEGHLGDDYESVHEVREVLEVKASRLAADRASEEDVLALRDAHAAMAGTSTEDIDALAAADIEFHRRIARAAGNEIFVVLLTAIAPTLIAPRTTNLVTGEGLQEALTAHADILAAIAAHDEARAAGAMQLHLDQVIARWSLGGDRHRLDVDELPDPEVA